jgi:acetate---CoA ligase (ADP-forming) subunit beta
MNNRIQETIEQAQNQGRSTLTEAEGKQLLREIGVETPSFEIVTDPDDAVSAAERIGYPAVVKVSSPMVTHKSEWADGAGVVVGLEDSNTIRAAAERIFVAAESEGIDADVLIEEGADLDAGTEVIVGGLRDASFGPVVLMGLGGVFTEVFEDTSHRLAPVSADEAKRALEELQAAKLLSGYRGRPPANIESLASTVSAVGDLLVEREMIREIDLNPVLVSEDGSVALDALVVLEDPDNE